MSISTAGADLYLALCTINHEPAILNMNSLRIVFSTIVLINVFHTTHQSDVKCVDLYPDCAQRSSLCQNSVFSILMTIQCGLTCGNCHPIVHKLTSATERSQPLDATTSGSVLGNSPLEMNCVDFVSVNDTQINGVPFCKAMKPACGHEIYGASMRKLCSKTCQVCGPTMDAIALECKDYFDPYGKLSCEEQAQKCDDPTYGSITKSLCPVTCGICVPKPTVAMPCTDALEETNNSTKCSEMIDLCTVPDYKEYMTQMCRKSCLMC